MKLLVFIVVASIIFATITFSQLLGPVQSLREAIEFEWIQPERTFLMGEPIYFEVIARNTSKDSAQVYELDNGAVRVDDILPFVPVRPGETRTGDTLAPGESARYRYILSDGPLNLYDPYFDDRSYGERVGLSCLPPGDYWLVYRKLWDVADSITFTVVEPPDSVRPILDSLAEAYVAYRVGRTKDAVALGFRLVEMSAESPYTARGLIFARGAAWENDMCEQALTLDSLFWEHFGTHEARSRFLPYPGTLRATAGIWGKCLDIEKRLERLGRLEARFGDDKEFLREIEHYRKAFTGKLDCPTCP